MSRSDWYVSDEVGRAIAALAAGGIVDTELLRRPEANRLAYRHGLTVPAARALDPMSPRGRYMAAVAARIDARRSCIDSHLRRILARLVEANVRVSVVKGPSVATKYRDPSIRTYTDVDLIIPREDLVSALDELAGYEQIGAIPTKVPAADKRDIMVRDPSGVQFTVDLHWDLFSFHQLGGVADAAMSEAWEAASFDPDHSLGPMWILPEPAVISFLSLHALLDHRFRLILFRDLKEWAAGGVDWDGLARFAGVHGVAEFNYLAWLIAARVLGADVSEEFLGEIRRGNWLERVAESYLRRVDLVRFDGHRVHPLNLALTLAHDRPEQRRRLLRKAPFAYPGWRRRVQAPSPSVSNTLDILVTSNARRGAEVFGQALADELVLRGWDVSLVSLCGGDEPFVETTPIVESRISLRGLRLAVLRGLRRRIRSRRPAVVFANGGATLRYAVAAALLTRRSPHIVYGSIGEPGFWLRGVVHRLLQRLLIGACAHVTAVSEATARALTSDLGVNPDKITVVHPGVAGHWFDLPSRTEREDPLRVIFAGSLSYEKNPLLAVEVAARLEGKANLRIAGDGSLRRRVEEAAGSNVEVLGSLADLTEQMEWADVLLLTSLTEGLPGVILEASASGIPVVASDVGGVGEVVVDGVTGFLVPSGDVDGFVEALSRLIDDDDMRSRMGAAARARVGDHFRMANSADAYEAVLRGATFR
jgi:glycosyltransferase involved in cell wall biosynthesis